MRSRRRKRKFPRISAVACLWALLAANVILGLFFSPLTSLRKVRVIGSSVQDQSRIAQELQHFREVPLLRIANNEFLASLQVSQDIETIQFLPNVFGRANVRIKLRTPVAKIVNSHVFLDEEGHTFVSDRKNNDLPVIVPPRRAFSLNLTMVGTWEVGTMAQLCKKLAAQVPNVAWTVELSDRGVISLQADGGAEVAFGSTESLTQKIEKLKSLVDTTPDLLQKVRIINLTAPEAPMVVR